jgi:hypothetical protein
MGKVVWGLIGGLLAVLVASVVVFGREATVWGVADAAPEPVRTLTVSILRGVTSPLTLVEDVLGLKFGAVEDITALAACGEADACVREKEQYLPERELRGMTGRLAVEPDGRCMFSATFGGGAFVATRVSLLFHGEEGQVFTTASAPVGVTAIGTTMPYQVDDAGCVFARENAQAFRWELLAAKGFVKPKEQPSP